MLIGLSNKNRTPQKQPAPFSRKRKKQAAAKQRARQQAKKGLKRLIKRTKPIWLECPELNKEFPGAPSVGKGVLVGTVAIYVLLDPRNNLVCYVGKTVNADRRCKKHFSVTARTCNSQLTAWKAELQKYGLSPVMLLIDSACERTWEEVERAWIAYFRSLGKLLNIEDGGLRVA